MKKTVDDGEARAMLKAAISDGDSFLRAVFSGAPKGAAHDWRKIGIKPVALKAGLRWQVSRFDARKDISKNHEAAELCSVLDEILGLGFKSVLVEGRGGSLSAQALRGGGYRIAQKALQESLPAADFSHDRKKKAILDADSPPPFLGMLGFLGAEGRLKADKRDKFTQINEFLRLLDEAGAFPERGAAFSAVDFGCGNAYLSFALYHHLSADLGIQAELWGVDRTEELIEKHRAKAENLGWSGMKFFSGSILDYEAQAAPDAVLALHACDTATDDAIARGIAWGSSLIVVAPCCHHELQTQLARTDPPDAFKPLFRHGLVSERLGDILTDAFRAQILRIKGYKTEVIQFVDPENSPKNLMIRAVKTASPAPAAFLEEYRAMKEFWKVQPYLESRVEGL